jgi:hypothetical protein
MADLFESHAFERAVKSSRAYVSSTQYPGVHTVYRGRKQVAGVRTKELAIVFLVEKKKPVGELADGERLPASVASFPTDVVECEQPKALQDPTKRHRPAPGGVSYGHVDITAGTLGGWVRRPDALWYALTNAHVGADVNRAARGDANLQPGPIDGGSPGADTLGTLDQRVHIHMGDSPPSGNPCEGGDGGKKGKQLAWRAYMAPANWLARLVHCPNRLRVVNLVTDRHAQSQHPACIPQAWPNLVDACVVGPAPEDDVHLGMLSGTVTYPTAVGDAVLGSPVEKYGRTTRRTHGEVIGVSATSRVSYGADGTALFDDQLIIEGVGGDFSAGGDSGSWVVSEGLLVGLLFAGGGGVTIANRAPNVFSILGVML